jgi:mannose-6-phosphate isomerase-like protein (cupin superfamily)
VGGETKMLAAVPDAMAPDGSEVRVLCASGRGSMAHFTLPAGAVSRAVAHRTIEELWFFVAGSGRMWRRSGTEETEVAVGPGVSISIPVGTSFQFRADAAAPLLSVGVAMPPWPGPDEAYAVPGCWPATVGIADC